MGSTIVVLLVLAMLTVFLGGAAWMVSQGNLLPGVLFALGAFGFFGAFVLPATGTVLQNVELPAIFETATIVAPDGQFFAVTQPLSRVQRYDSDGRFENGWFVRSGGGRVSIGLTTDGKIAIAAARTRQVEFFNLDGSPAAPPKPFVKRGKELMGSHLRPTEYLVDGVTLGNPIPAANPGIRWSTLLLFPLWHPLIGWLLIFGGAIAARRASRLGR